MSDMIGIPIDVIAQPEVGTLDAALLVGLIDGAIKDFEQTSRAFAGKTSSYVPNGKRASIQREELK